MSKKAKSRRPSKKVIVKSSTIHHKPKLNTLHDTLLKLFIRPDGATMHDTWNAGFVYPAMAALKIAERHGYKTRVVKRKGELTRYYAKRH